MQRHLILAAIVFLSASLAQADISVQLSSPEACTKLAGNWAGHGVATAGPVVCAYKGTAVINPTVDPTAYEIAIDLIRNNNNVICPQHEAMTLPLSCKDGTVTLKTEAANLSGTLDDEATEASLSGTVKFVVANLPITAKVSDMVLRKS